MNKYTCTYNLYSLDYTYKGMVEHEFEVEDDEIPSAVATSLAKNESLFPSYRIVEVNLKTLRRI